MQGPPSHWRSSGLCGKGLDVTTPIHFRFNAVEKVESGQTLEDALAVSRILADESIDALDVSLVAHSSWREVEGQHFLVTSSALPKDQPAGCECLSCRGGQGGDRPSRDSGGKNLITPPFHFP